jgi:surface protein
MKHKIIAKDKDHLRELVQQEMLNNGNKCNLNHIDVSQVTDMMEVFARLKFNGDISEWDVSNVTRMKYMFYGSDFNGDISKWNTSKVKSMKYMFLESKFNGDISNWDVSNVYDMSYMFVDSNFHGDLSHWKPYSLDHEYCVKDMFKNCPAPVPYWSQFENQDERINAIDAFQRKKQLKEDLNSELKANEKLQQKIKI